MSVSNTYEKNSQILAFDAIKTHQETISYDTEEDKESKV